MKITFEANQFELTELSEAIRQYEIHLEDQYNKWEEKLNNNPKNDIARKRMTILEKRMEDIANISFNIGQAEIRAHQIENI